jgi:C1A family cysteine protease
LYAVKINYNVSDVVPVVHDFSGEFTVLNQGSVGSCGSHAIVAAMQYEFSKDERKVLAVDLNELYHYYVTRTSDYMNTFPADSGMYLREGLKAAQKHGVTAASLYEQESIYYNKSPSFVANAMSSLWRIKNYRRVSIGEFEYLLSINKPVVFGFLVHTDIFRTPATGDVQPSNNVFVGGHAVVATGYDALRVNPDGTRGSVRFVNSWGARWGDNGFGWISVSYLDRVLLDAWVVEV